VENVEHPAQYVEAVLRRTQTRHIERTYELNASDYNDDPIEFLSILARKGGRLLKGGEPDVDGVAKMVLNDFLRGKIPWFTPPPSAKKDGAAATEPDTDAAADREVVEGREGRLGEMPGKRKAAGPIDAEEESSDVGSDEEDEEFSASDDEGEDGPSDDDEDAFEQFDDENDGTSDPESDAEGGTEI
jgi:nuclear GTP-binding protein